jgi:hypothetical protein
MDEAFGSQYLPIHEGEVYSSVEEHVHRYGTCPTMAAVTNEWRSDVAQWYKYNHAVAQLLKCPYHVAPVILPILKLWARDNHWWWAHYRVDVCG